MDVYEVSQKVIKNVCSGIKDFQQSLKLETKEMSRQDSLEVSSICGLFFRNYFLIEHLASIMNFPKNSSEFIFLGLLYVNNAFKRRIDSNRMFNDFLTLIIQKKYSISREEIAYIKEVISVKRTFSFFDVKPGSLDYYILRFNKPGWLIKLLTNQYGRNTGLRIIYEMSSMPNQYVTTSYLKSFNPPSSFKKIDDDLYYYSNDTSVRKEEDYHDKNIYLTQVAYQKALKNFKYSNSNVALVLGDNLTIAYDFVKRFCLDELNNEISLVSLNLEKNYKVFDTLRSYNLRKTQFYEEKEENLRPVFKENQDFILYSPLTSNFELFRRNPEYGVYFQVVELDNIINSIKKGIREVVKQLEVDGKMLYIVPTIEKKETKVLIEELMDEIQDDYVLEDEKLCLPTQEDNSLAYYAIIRRVK